MDVCGWLGGVGAKEGIVHGEITPIGNHHNVSNTPTLSLTLTQNRLYGLYPAKTMTWHALGVSMQSIACHSTVPSPLQSSGNPPQSVPPSSGQAAGRTELESYLG
jgi:hypothetical protein